MSKSSLPLVHNLGFPRIGEKRELKKAAEAYWQGRASRAELEETGRELRRRNWLLQRRAGIDLIPSNDFSFYDQVLDTTCLVGNVPARFGWDGGPADLDTAFAIARGIRSAPQGAACACAACGPASAGEMTKWFDTNYHYIVPEFHAATRFALSSDKVFDEFSEALALGVPTMPVLVGPVTYLKLGKAHDPAHPRFDPLSLLDGLLPVYAETLRRLESLGAVWVQLDEPIFATDLSAGDRAALERAYAVLAGAAPRLKLLVAAYFGGLRDNREAFLKLPAAALHVDLVRAPEELDALLQGVPQATALSLGVVNGRNVWRTDFDAVLPLLRKAAERLGPDRVMISPSCSLLHSPVTLRHEARLDSELRSWLGFAEEKLEEAVTLRNLLAGAAAPSVLEANRAALASRRASRRIHRPEIAARTAAAEVDARRISPFGKRQAAQRARLGLPLFPTTTIGSFPQTEAVRAARAKWKKGELSTEKYEEFLKAETLACVRFQEEIGMDVLVHGEFERNDMVEYFGEQLDGFAFTANGWVQSYGSRCVKPPIIYGDVARAGAMTVRWSAYAQSLSRKPVKGMLTGPITMLQWSFVRDDQPRRDTAFQIALALRDEVADLEAAGIAAIQIDEPALREGLPLRRADWQEYLDWAVAAFRLASTGVRDDTQIHTHMCYAEFNDIIEAIAALDADVITIETSRSNMELLEAFAGFRYPNEIGPGVYDIHSPRVPAALEMEDLIVKAASVLPVENIWINPDCGLKTRAWPEVKSSLTNMAQAARHLRARWQAK